MLNYCYKDLMNTIGGRGKGENSVYISAILVYYIFVAYSLTDVYRFVC